MSKTLRNQLGGVEFDGDPIAKRDLEWFFAFVDSPIVRDLKATQALNAPITPDGLAGCLERLIKAARAEWEASPDAS